jgi:hypothetical protein
MNQQDNERLKYSKFIYVNLEKFHPSLGKYLRVNQIFDVIKKGNINCRDRLQLSRLVSSLKSSVEKKENDDMQRNKAIENSQKPLTLSNQPQQRGDLWRKPRYQLDRVGGQNNNNNERGKELDNLPDRLGLVVEPPNERDPNFDQRNMEIETANQVKFRNQSLPRQYGNFERMLQDEYDNGEDENQTDRFILMARERKIFNENRKTHTDYVCIDSKDRNFDLNPSPNQLDFKFLSPNFTASDARGGFVNRRFHNVTSIELLKVIIKDTRNITNASDNPTVPAYLILEIEEMDQHLNGSNDALNKGSFVLDNYETLGDHRHYTSSDLGTFTHTFEPYINLNKLTISLRTPDGELYSFGTVNDSATDTIFCLIFKFNRLRKNLVSSHLEVSD